jgi:hypothetical protein
MYLRQISVQVGTGGQGLELAPNNSSLPKITFQTFQHTKEIPDHCQIRVYNMSQDTVQSIQNEYTQVVLSAGYQDGPYGQIFSGTIIQVKIGYEGMGGIDSYVDVIASDGDVGYTNWVVNSAIGKGSTYQSRLNALNQAQLVANSNSGGTGSSSLGSGTGSGISSTGAGTTGGVTSSPTQGYVGQLPSGSLPRGRVFYGNWRDHMRDFAASTDTTYFITNNNQVNVMPVGGNLPGQTVTLTSSTGLIGFPEQTELGIKIRSLLNPNLKPGCQVNIQNSAVLQADLQQGYQNSGQNAFLPSIANNGVYNVIVCEHNGDTRGNPWYSDLICIAPGQVLTPGLIQKGYTGYYATKNNQGTGTTGAGAGTGTGTSSTGGVSDGEEP